MPFEFIRKWFLVHFVVRQTLNRRDRCMSYAQKTQGYLYLRLNLSSASRTLLTASLRSLFLASITNVAFARLSCNTVLEMLASGGR